MKRIFSYLFAILFAVGTTGVFTSCQEDAVEIDYTISVTVNNDLTEVINAINNGTFADPSEAIQSLVDAINKLSGDQETKFKALQDAINGLATTLDAKIAVLEAAMKAQTVTLEGKIGLLEAAIKALPDYTEKLTAIQTALEAIKQQNSDNATAIADLQASIDAIAKAVEEGNKSQEDALTEILALLEGIDTAVNPDYVTFTANAAQTLSYEGSDLQYSLDGTTFQDLLANTPIEFGVNKKLYLRGVNNLDGNFYESEGYTKGYKISFGKDDVPVACTGDIRTLIDYKTYKTVDTSNATFRSLFEDCTELTSAPALPATTLAAGCYFGMFYGCEKLTEAPELPATTLADYCYRSMFTNCWSLKDAPELPATTLAEGCYENMFYYCMSLKDAPELPATTLAEGCYEGMFSNCFSLENSPALPATTLAN